MVSGILVDGKRNAFELNVLMTKLARHITLWPLVLYGMGDILGAGIYGLVGKAAGQMGNAVWMAFLVSMIAAGFTGLSYASLGSRYPVAAGAPYIISKAFKNSFLAYLIGLAILASGLTSMATSARVFAGYFTSLIPVLPNMPVVIGFALVLTLIVFLGIKHAIGANSLLATIEILGLLFIIAVGIGYIGDVNYFDTATAARPQNDLGPGLLLSGAVLTFYSFIGFEDILNVAEEVKNPETTLPLGLLLAVAFSSIIYILISLIAVSVIPAGELAASKQPLVDVAIKAAPWFPAWGYSVISLLAVSNTALLNFVMGSRLLYGMSQQGLFLKFFGEVSPKRKSPDRAVFLILAILLTLTFVGDISALARATSVLLLLSFALVNLSLIILKRTDKKPGRFEIPSVIPALGFLICVAMLTQGERSEYLIAGGILAVIVGLYFFIRPSAKAIEKMGT